MREQIAVLDGLSMVADGYAGRAYTPEPSEGANYQGGSNWHPFTPTLPSSEGLASLGSLGMDAMPAGYAGEGYTPEPSAGANYQGGSNWHPYTPTLPSSDGLASGLSIEALPGYAGHSVNPVPGNGQNYTGGSDWDPYFPTSVSSKGLVGMGYGDVLEPIKGDPRNFRRWVDPCATRITPRAGMPGLNRAAEEARVAACRRQMRTALYGRRGLSAVPGGESPPWKFPMYDERELPVVRAIRCGVTNAYRTLFGVSYPLEVENCVQNIRAMLRRDGMAALGRAMAATKQENAYLGAYYVMSRATVDTYRGNESPRARALRASQMCG